MIIAPLDPRGNHAPGAAVNHGGGPVAPGTDYCSSNTNVPMNGDAGAPLMVRQAHHEGLILSLPTRLRSSGSGAAAAEGGRARPEFFCAVASIADTGKEKRTGVAPGPCNPREPAERQSPVPPAVAVGPPSAAASEEISSRAEMSEAEDAVAHWIIE